MADAVAIQQEIGQDKVFSRSQQLAAYARKEILANGKSELRSPTDTEMSGAISTFFHPNLNPNRATELYDKYRITTPIYPSDRWGQLPAGGLEQRVSTHIYNSFAQIDTLVEALSRLRSENFQTIKAKRT